MEYPHMAHRPSLAMSYVNLLSVCDVMRVVDGLDMLPLIEVWGTGQAMMGRVVMVMRRIRRINRIDQEDQDARAGTVLR